MRTSALVTVSVASDTVVEGDEFFNVIIPVEGRPTSEDFVIQSVEVSSDRVTILDDPADRGVITVTAVTSTVSEGSEVTFRVDLSGGVTAEEVIGVEWSVSCVVGSGITAGDFADSVCPSGTVEIVSGETYATFAVRTVVDNVVEGSEEFTVTLMTDVVPNIGGRITVSDSMSSASATIEDTDRGVVSVTVVTRTVSEGGDVTFRVELSDGVSVREPIVVAWVVNCEGGVTAEDFVGSPCEEDTVTIAEGRSSATFFVSTNDDDVFEGDEEFTVRLTSVLPEGRVTISDTMSTASATISDNDAGIGFEDLFYEVSEGEDSVTLIVVLSGAISSSDDLIVNVRTVDGTAGDQDYEGIDIPLNFTNFFGSSSVPVSVDITPDRIVEGDESFVVTLSGARVSVARSSATVTILDDDRGVISVEAATDMVLEGDDVTFTVNLSGDGGDVTGSADISVAWSVSCGGDITALDFEDSPCQEGRATIVSGETSATFTVRTADDSMAEAMEVFIVMLTGVSPEIEDRITISDSMSVARVTILDDDAIGVEIGFSPTAYRVDEDAGNVELTVSVLSGDIEAGVSVAVTVMTMGEGSAVVGEDYTSTTATLTFTSSVTEATVTVDISDDTVVEGNETFEVELSGDRVSSGSGVATVTITDDDAVGVEIGFSPDEYIVDEDAVSITLTVSVLVGTIEVGDSVTLSVRTIDGSAVAGEDYSEVIRTLTFNADTQTVTVNVMIENDGLAEGEETFEVELSGERVSSGSGVATVTITDDDAVGVEIGFSPDEYIVDEDAGSITLTVSVLVGTIEVGDSVRLSVRTIDGTAVAGEDYTATTATLTFTSSMTEATVTVFITDDTVVEGDEFFDVKLSGDRVSSVLSVARVTIEDDDAVVIGFSPDEYRVDEDAGSVELTVLVLSGTIEVGESVTVDVRTIDGIAVVDEDYTELTETLTFDADMLTLMVTVMIEDDMLLELDQHFFVELSGNRVSDSASVARVTILDNDVDAGELPDGDDPSSGPGEGEVLFEELRYDVLEGAGSVTLVAILSRCDIVE